MVPFAVLVSSFLGFWLLGRWVPLLGPWPYALRAALAIMFLVTASAHWGRLRPDLVRMVPEALPNPELIVTLTGVAEIVGAAGLLFPATAPYAAGGLVLLMLAMFPANVHAARAGMTLGGEPVTPLGLRTLLQLVFVAATLAAMKVPGGG